jgi:hypothetical protein
MPSSKTKFPAGGPKTIEVDSSWLDEPDEELKAQGPKSKRPKRPPPVPGRNVTVPPMPGEPVRRETMEVKAEWLEPGMTVPPSKRRKSRASLVPVKVDDKKPKKAPPIPREE